MFKHRLLLTQAVEQLGDAFPLDVAKFYPEKMDPLTSLKIDGFRTRFSDLQDMIGSVMFKNITYLDQDESRHQPLSTIKRQALMEKRGIINLNAWLALRTIRNEFTHEYPDEHAEKAANLNSAWQAVAVLQRIVTAIADYIEQQHGFDIKQCD